MKKSIYFHLSKPFTPERERKIAVSAILSVRACVRGMCSDAGGYYEETEMRQEIPLIGNKNTILSI